METEFEIEALQLLRPADAALYLGDLDPDDCALTCDGQSCKASCGISCTVTG